MKIHIAFIIIICLLTKTVKTCNDTSSCFIKRLFDFSYPAESLYNITLNNLTVPSNYIIMGYGDFNSDLRSDYVALQPETNTLNIYYYQTSTQLEGQYVMNNTIQSFGCSPLNIYLYDADNNLALDILVWGEYANSSKCLYLLLQNNNQFTNATDQPLIFDPSNTQPILFQSKITGTRQMYFLIFNIITYQRQIIEYSLNRFQTYPWSDFFIGSNYISIPFSSPHWNSFIDLTNDCNADIVINNQNQEIQFWIFSASNKKFLLSYKQTTPGITSMTFVDLNYDGIQDIITTYPSSIQISKGTTPTPDQFCLPNKTSFSFNWNNTITIPIQNCLLQAQNIHFGDLDIDGYPDLMFTCTQNNLNHIYLYQNFIDDNGTFGPFYKYQQIVDQYVTFNVNVTRASFLDVLENGIVDIILAIDNTYTQVLYNNYLYQNYYYIKGYATNGISSNYGNQIPGPTFYYLNSLGNQQKVAIYSQMIQTAYNAMPMPYIVTGLGRSNNYVEQFTIGRGGDMKSWSPIIPNSQLAVFTGQTSSSWSIKIFIMPTDSIVYVIIVCIVILAVLGGILIVLKCIKKKEEPALMVDYM